MAEREKQKTLDAVTEELRVVGVKEDEWRKVIEPYVELIGLQHFLQHGAQGAFSLSRSRSQAGFSDRERKIDRSTSGMENGGRRGWIRSGHG